jgi:hypothetical protein
MGVGENLNELSKDTREYVKRSIDSYKLQIVENLSLLLGDIICGFVVSMLLFLAFLFVLAAIVMVLSVYIGYAFAVLAVVGVLLLSALVVYVFRVPLFVNAMVERLVTLFYGKEGRYD